MPRLSVWLVRTSLAFLAAGVSLGAAALAGKGLAAGPWVSRLVPIHAEFLLVGWTVQLVLGVAYWILPRLRHGRGARQPGACHGWHTACSTRASSWPRSAERLGPGRHGPPRDA